MLKRFAFLVAGLAPSRKRHAGLKRQPRIARLWVMTDADRLPDPGQILQMLPPGSGLVIRHTDPSQRRALAAAIIPLCAARRIQTLISSDWRMADALRAGGVHLPEAHLNRVDPGLRLWRKTKRVVVSCAAHTEAAVRTARGCDAVFVSPVFPTRSHPGRKSLGRLRYAQLARRARAPVIALGGLTFGNVMSLRGTRTAGVAGISFATE